MKPTRMIGKLLRAIDPKFYTSIRWNLRSVMGNPMAQLFLLPFLVRKNDTVIDIGANIGEITIKLAELVGANGTVHSFEPIQKNYEELSTNVKIAGMESRTVLYKMGLSDKNYTATFTVPKERDTEATLIPHHDEAWKDFGKENDKYFPEVCEVKTLETVFDGKLTGNISFIKCDVEGCEFFVFKGAEKLLKSKNPPILMFEAYERWTNDFDYHPRDMFKYLNEIGGYQIYWISPSGLEFVSLDSKTVPGIFYQWVDFIAVVPEVHCKRINVNKFTTV
ncbi:MAG: FkbM family methyltransferase [Ignavibacteriales bacterium]|nr:FkbM family methyltransferase [Ignavibacteriales bacterium]